MAGKYDHLFVSDMGDVDKDMINEGAEAGAPKPSNVGPGWALMRAEDVPESQIHLTHVWITESDQFAHWVNDHEHDYDEVLIWKGSDPNNEKDLGAVLEMWIEDEKHTVTTTGSVYIPAGTRHCPLDIVRVDRPFLFSALSLSGGKYSSDENMPKK